MASSTCSHIRVRTSMKPERAAPRQVMPAAQPLKAMKNSRQVNSEPTRSSEGETPTTKGTSPYPNPSRTALLPDLNGTTPALQAATQPDTTQDGTRSPTTPRK